MRNQNPEQKARDLIDQHLVEAGWIVQDRKAVNLGAGPGIAIREHHNKEGFADYLLYLNRKPIGIIEAKKTGTLLRAQGVEDQSKRYAHADFRWKKENDPLPFVFESTGVITQFTDLRDPRPRSREIFNFPRPETLEKSLRNAESLRDRLQKFPPLNHNGLRNCQVVAIENLEKSFKEGRPRALIQMATGSGKTYTAITSIYRLLKHIKGKRVLFLVDTRNLGEQAMEEFQAFKPKGDQRTFTELYNVQLLKSNKLHSASKVCISTIQRMYSILRGEEELDESLETENPNERVPPKKVPEVAYNKDIPPETFDFIIIDECHRSIYNLWRQVLEYFDAFLVGLTATPDNRTFGFFEQNVVSEYTHEEAVRDGVNVGFEVYKIDTKVTKEGAKIETAGFKEVGFRSKIDRKTRWATPDEETLYTGRQLDRSVVNPSQIRTVIRTFKEKLFTELFPGRKYVPKTLIFAKTDSHAEDIIKMVRKEFGEGNDFCKKVTYQAKEDPKSIIAQFRNSHYPRIAVTVDMIATGTDIRPLECLLFMRDVRSRNYYEQMKGRGTRVLEADKLKEVSGDAKGPKTHFILVDAVGVEDSQKLTSQPLERKRSVPLKNLMENVAMGERDEDTLSSLASRLVRLQNQLSSNQLDKVKALSGGKELKEIIRDLFNAFDPDLIEAKINAAGPDTPAGAKEIAESHTLEACLPFDKPELREYLDGARRNYEQIIDTQNLDEVLNSGFAKDELERAQHRLRKFREFLKEKQDEVTALQIWYGQPHRRRELTLKMLSDLRDALSVPPWGLQIPELWEAYERLYQGKVKGGQTTRQLTDLISLLSFEVKVAEELRPFADGVNQRFKEWIFRRNAGNTQFTPDQTEWLRLIKDHIAGSLNVTREDFDYSPFAEQGGLAKVWNLFGKDLDGILAEMNDELVA